MHLQRMICNDEYKLIYYPEIEKTILYNLKQDSLEMNDLAADPQYTAKIKELKTKLKKQQKEYSDPLVID